MVGKADSQINMEDQILRFNRSIDRASTPGTTLTDIILVIPEYFVTVPLNFGNCGPILSII